MYKTYVKIRALFCNIYKNSLNECIEPHPNKKFVWMWFLYELPILQLLYMSSR